MKLSLAITTYQRDSLTLKSFANVLHDPRIGEIVIVDDCSDARIFDNLCTVVKGIEKVRISTNEINLGMMANKALSISKCINEWVIIFDSDNVISPDYMDSVERLTLNPDTIYCPSFARPTFDYRRYAGMTIGIPQAKKMLNEPMGNACLNTCNYLVHRDTYLSVFKQDNNVKGTDTLSFAYQWLKAGKKMHVVKGMEYDHLIHDGSGFLKDAEFNMKKAEEYKLKIQSL